MPKTTDYVLLPLLILGFVLCFLMSIKETNLTATTETATTKIHFLIPGSPGGGWDATARGVGEALAKSGLQSSLSYENMSGGGGGKAIAHLIETAAQQQTTLMVNSTPIVIRSLQGIFPQSFRDLTPVAAIIGDYGAFVVTADSKYKDWRAVIADFKRNFRSVKIAGGSVRGSMDHLVAAMAFKSAECDPSRVIYVPYDGGGKAMAGLLCNETQVLATGLGEALDMQNAGQVRILAITADKRVDIASSVPTLKEMGYDITFVNWRGFFAPPGISKSKVKAYNDLLQKMYNTQQWEAICKRNGWVNIYKPGVKEFTHFLKSQERQLGDLMRELGFLK